MYFIQEGLGIGTGGAYPFSLSSEFSGGSFRRSINASLDVCSAQTLQIGDPDEAVDAEMQCCNISNGNDDLVCEYRIGFSTGREQSVGCNDNNAFIAGCSGWVDSTNPGAIVKYEMYIIYMIFAVFCVCFDICSEYMYKLRFIPQSMQIFMRICCVMYMHICCYAMILR